MESKNIELITKMVIDAINKSEDKGNGFMVPIGVSARHVHLTQEHVEDIIRTRISAHKEKRSDGRTVCVKRNCYDHWSEASCD